MEWLTEITAWHWLAIMLAFAVGEMLVSGFFLLWFSVGALVVAIVLWIFPSLTWEWQLLIFSVVSASLLLLIRPYLRDGAATSTHPDLNHRGSQYIGQTFVLIAGIENGRGKINVNDTLWTVKSVDGSNIPVGAKVRVLSLDGTIMQVEPV